MKRRLADIALEAEIRADSFRSRERREHKDAVEAGRLCRRQAAEISRLERERDSERRERSGSGNDKEDGPVGILNKSGYSGVAVHDHWAAYLTLCLIHAECNVHIERCIRNGAAYDKYEECTEMLEFFAKLREMKKADLEQGRTGGTRPEDYQEAREKMIDICTRDMKKREDQMEKGDPEVMKKFTPPCCYAPSSG